MRLPKPRQSVASGVVVRCANRGLGGERSAKGSKVHHQGLVELVLPRSGKMSRWHGPGASTGTMPVRGACGVRPPFRHRAETRRAESVMHHLVRGERPVGGTPTGATGTVAFPMLNGLIPVEKNWGVLFLGSRGGGGSGRNQSGGSKMGAGGRGGASGCP